MTAWLRRLRQNFDSLSPAARLVSVLVLLLIFLMAARTPLDPDLWWHLRAGQETWQNAAPYTVDTLSYTRAGAVWVNHSWLGQLSLYLSYRWGGFFGVSLWVAALAVLSMAVLLMQMDGPHGLRAALLVLGSLVAATTWAPRPQMFTLLFLPLLQALITHAKNTGRDRFWLLPPFFLLWSNLHGGYSAGILFLAAILAGEVLNHLLDPASPQTLSWPRLGRLAGWSGLSLLAVLVNPNGLNTWLIPFQTLDVSVVEIDEWFSPNFHNLNEQPMLWLLMLTLFALALANRRADGGDLLAVIGFGALALMAKRGFGPFAVVALPVLSRALWTAWRAAPRLHSLLARLQTPPRPQAGWQKAVNLTLVGLIAAAAWAKAGVVSHPTAMQIYTAQQYPARAVAWLASQPRSGHLLNSYNWGGYLTWAYPQQPVFIDGRADLFGNEIMGEWLTLVRTQPGWEALLQKWDIRWVLLESGTPLADALQTRGWPVRYLDAQAVVLEHP